MSVKEEVGQIITDAQVEIAALQARVKSLEGLLHEVETWDHHESAMELFQLREKMKNVDAIIFGFKKENARLQRLVDMNQKVVEACRKNTHRSPEIAEALRELDGEKK